MQAKGPKNRHKRRNTGKKAYQQARRPKKQSKGPKSRQKSLKRAAERPGSRHESLEIVLKAGGNA